jgi:hypothetical protein
VTSLTVLRDNTLPKKHTFLRQKEFATIDRRALTMRVRIPDAWRNDWFTVLLYNSSCFNVGLSTVTVLTGHYFCHISPLFERTCCFFKFGQLIYKSCIYKIIAWTYFIIFSHFGTRWKLWCLSYMVMVKRACWLAQIKFFRCMNLMIYLIYRVLYLYLILILDGRMVISITFRCAFSLDLVRC